MIKIMFTPEFKLFIDHPSLAKALIEKENSFIFSGKKICRFPGWSYQ